MSQVSRNIQIDVDSLVLVPQGADATYATRSRSLATDTAPLRYRDEFEFVYVTYGELFYRADTRRHVLHEGDAIFVNSGVPHVEYSATSGSAMRVILTCHPQTLYGSKNSALWKRYFRKLSLSRGVREKVLHRDGEPWEREAAALVERAWSAFAASEPLYELTVRESLARATLLVIDNTSGRSSASSSHTSTNAIPSRVEAMIDFIERRYTEPLTLRQIASAVNVSEREAQRSFVAAMGHTPIQHLATHRLMVAQRMLLTTEDSLSTIAQACGFSNQSYFGRCFREHFGCTPSEYRKRGWEDVGSEDR